MTNYDRIPSVDTRAYMPQARSTNLPITPIRICKTSTKSDQHFRSVHIARIMTSILLLVLWAGPAPAQTVFAAASLSSALTELAPHYPSMNLSFAGSSILAKQIEAGAPADIYFAANAEWMDYLQTRGHIESGSRTDLLGNALVVIATRGLTFPVRIEKSFAFPASFSGRLALGDPDHVPAGLYAREALEHLGWWPALKSRIAAAPDVRAALVYVERGECAVGLVYATDAAQSTRSEIMATIPDSLHRPITYPMAIVKGRTTPATRRLLEFLRSDLATDLYRRHGFTLSETKRAYR